MINLTIAGRVISPSSTILGNVDDNGVTKFTVTMPSVIEGHNIIDLQASLRYVLANKTISSMSMGTGTVTGENITFTGFESLEENEESYPALFSVFGKVEIAIVLKLVLEDKSVPFYWSTNPNKQFNNNETIATDGNLAKANPNEIKLLNLIIGGLSVLTTTVKTSIVLAINSLVTALGGKVDKATGKSLITDTVLTALLSDTGVSLKFNSGVIMETDFDGTVEEGFYKVFIYNNTVRHYIFTDILHVVCYEDYSVIQYYQDKKRTSTYIGGINVWGEWVGLDDKVDKVTGERLINATEITKLSNTSNTNSGDQDLSALVPKSQKPIIKWVAGTHALGDVVYYPVDKNIYYCHWDLGTNALPTDFFYWTQLTGDNARIGGITLYDIAVMASEALQPNGEGTALTETFTQAVTRANIATGETHATIFGKIKKYFADLKTVAFTGSYSDLTDKPTIPTTTASVADSNDKRYVTDAEKTAITHSNREFLDLIGDKTVVDYTVATTPISMLASQVTDGGEAMVITIPNHGFVENNILELSGAIPSGITKNSNTKTALANGKAYVLVYPIDNNSFYVKDNLVGNMTFFPYVDGGTNGWNLSKPINIPISFSSLNMETDGEEWNVKISGTLLKASGATYIFFRLNGLDTNIYYSASTATSYQANSFLMGGAITVKTLWNVDIKLNLKRVSENKISVVLTNNGISFAYNSTTNIVTASNIGGHVGEIPNVTEFALLLTDGGVFLNGTRIIIERVN